MELMKLMGFNHIEGIDGINGIDGIDEIDGFQYLMGFNKYFRVVNSQNTIAFTK